MPTMPPVRISGPLVPYIEGVWSHLLSVGYAATTSRNLLRLASHLSRWLLAAEIRLSELTREHVEAFFDERRRTGCQSYFTSRSLRAILQYLEVEGVVSLPEVEVARSAVDDLLDDYEQFLVKERGLKASTAHGYYRS